MNVRHVMAKKNHHHNHNASFFLPRLSAWENARLIHFFVLPAFAFKYAMAWACSPGVRCHEAGAHEGGTGGQSLQPIENQLFLVKARRVART